MSRIDTQPPKAILGSCLAILVLCGAIFLVSPAGASASISEYCNNHTLPGNGECKGVRRNLYQTFGWGNQHSVCVGYSVTEGTGEDAGLRCSGGPEEGVYSVELESDLPLYPAIRNNAAGSNTVHGIALQ